jgi:uncharacterized protein involved in exopolysaccharide biosynthesis
MELSLHPRSILRMLWQRKWWFATPAVLVGVVVLSLVLFLPPVYRSEATILIEDQNIPENIVPSLVTEYIDRRLDTLTRRVLGTDNLLRIAEVFDLYPDERKMMTRMALANRISQNISTNQITTEVTDPDSGRTSETTVAFEIMFDYGDPQTARRVTNELVSLYMSLNQEKRREVAEETTQFLSSELAGVEDRITRLEDELADFQRENRELLPDEAAFKRQLLANTEQQLRSLDQDLRSLREREGFLTTELALTDEFVAAARSGGAAASPEAQLEMLRAELATARARYSASHPDVVRLAREVASLESVVGERSGAVRLIDQEQTLISELASLRERYTDAHPDVQRVQNELDGVRSAIQTAGGRNAVGNLGGSGTNRNDTYVQLSAQLNSVQTQIRSIDEQRRQLREERRTLQEQLARAPAVEREYTRLTRSLENAITDREALADKEASASLSGALESAAISERFVLAEPATLPLAPVSPREKLIVAVGFVLAMGFGGAAVVTAEFLDRSIRSAQQLTRLLGDSPLVAIPVLSSPAESRRIWIRRTIIGLVVIAISAGGLLWVHHTVTPLDVLGYQLRGSADRWLNATFPDSGLELEGGEASAGGDVDRETTR